ncbi:MAG: phospholipase A [Sphingomonas sp.]
MRIALALPIALPLALIAAPCAAQTLHPVVEPPQSAQEALSGVDVFLLNEGRETVPVAAPDTIQTMARDGTSLTLELIRSTADTAPVAPGGFVKLRYRLAPLAPGLAAAAPAAPKFRAPAEQAEGERTTDTARGAVSSFVARFSPHEPTYFVAGAGDARAKFQFSFALQPFASTGPFSYLKVAYTQTVFAGIGLPSGPITSVTYSPEGYAEVPLSDTARAAFGYRHDSNGGGPSDSVDANRVFVRVNKRFDLGRGWRLDVAPQGWFYVGSKGIATDLPRFWGNGSITASLGQEGGVKFQIFARGNPRTGQGAGELFVSYPIASLGLRGVGLYLFGQAFTGYGETLPGYNRADTHARIGVSFTR